MARGLPTVADGNGQVRSVRLSDLTDELHNNHDMDKFIAFLRYCRAHYKPEDFGRCVEDYLGDHGVEYTCHCDKTAQDYDNERDCFS